MSFREELFRNSDVAFDIEETATKVSVGVVPFLLSNFVVVGGIMSGIIPSSFAPHAFSAVGMGTLGGVFLMMPATVPAGQKVGDAINKVLDLRNAAKRRKACNDSLQSISLSGIKAQYQLCYDYLSSTAEGEGIIGFDIAPRGSKYMTDEESFRVSEQTFNTCFNVTSIKKKFKNIEEINRELDMCFGEYHDIDLDRRLGVDSKLDKKRAIDLKEHINNINDKYGTEGECELIDDVKIFIGDNTYVKDGSECAMFLETPGTKKPNLHNPIIIKHREDLENLVYAMKS